MARCEYLRKTSCFYCTIHNIKPHWYVRPSVVKTRVGLCPITKSKDCFDVQKPGKEQKALKTERPLLLRRAGV